MDTAPDKDYLIPRTVPREEAQRLLTESYRELDEGKILRTTNKLLRKRGIDPPMDVQYVAEPLLDEDPRGWAILLQADILIYEPFPEMDACRDAFEYALGYLLLARLDRNLRRWVRNRRNRGPQ